MHLVPVRPDLPVFLFALGTFTIFAKKENMKRISALLIGCSVIFTASCNQKSGLLILDSFPSVEQLMPSDSTLLSDWGIQMPLGIVVIDEKFVIQHEDGDVLVSVLEKGERKTVFRNGRGPNELLEPTSLVKKEGCFNIYDSMRRVLLSVDMHSSDSTAPSIDTLASIKNVGQEGYAAPIYLYNNDRSYVSSGYQPGYWYTLVDSNGKILDGVEYISFSGKNFNEKENYVIHLNSFVAIHPEKSKGVCVMSDADAISLFEIESDMIHEYCRKVYSSPSVEGTREPNSPILRHLPGSYRSFRSVAADEDYIYALYSGNLLRDADIPASECRNLLVYDWEGNAVKRIILGVSINAFQIQRDTIYGVSMHPESRLYKFVLDI